jgi:diguanylate cyclase (GGDEF)-like protein
VTCGADLASPRPSLPGGSEVQSARTRDQNPSDQNQTLSDQDQTASDRDQTASDQDQRWSDQDQTASDRDQRTADEDQHAADDDLAAGGDELNYHRSARAREHSSRDRAAISTLRDDVAALRLQTGEDRDQAAMLRDRGGDGRDHLAELHDLEDDLGASREDILSRAERDRARAAADRAKAADDRARAAMDRQCAAAERSEALQSRSASADLLNLATTDELTGAWTRRFGVQEVSRQIERAHRTGGKLALAFIDVDNLKALNDAQGHIAGDALLRRIGDTVRANLRPYDVLVRYGGDELVCAMPNVSVAKAQKRFQKIIAALGAGDVGSISFGLGAAQPSDSVEDLIARADNELLEERRARQK